MTDANLRPFIRRYADRACPYALPPSRTLAATADTGGRLALFEVTFRPGTEPPAHIHHTSAEAIFMLDGRLDGWVGDTALLIGSREMAVLPRSVPRRWQVTPSAEGIARGLMLFAPAAPQAHIAATVERDIDWIPEGYQPGIRHMTRPKPCFYAQGETFRQLATEEETGGLFSATLWASTGRSPVAPHLHSTADEGIYVLDGAVQIDAGSWSVTAYPGDFVFLPGGIPHSHRAAHDAPSMALTLLMPAAAAPILRPEMLAERHRLPTQYRLAAALS